MSLQALIERKLREELEPSHLEVINESGMHNAPAGAESHFKVIVVSEKFEGVSLSSRTLLPILCARLTEQVRLRHNAATQVQVVRFTRHP